mgnify:CR=1 FL=1
MVAVHEEKTPRHPFIELTFAELNNKEHDEHLKISILGSVYGLYAGLKRNFLIPA